MPSCLNNLLKSITVGLALAAILSTPAFPAEPVDIYYYETSADLGLILGQNKGAKSIKKSDCPAKGIIVTSTVEDYEFARRKCPKRTVGLMINPAFLSVMTVKDDGGKFYGISSAATILMQLGLAQQIFQKNDFETIKVFSGTPLERDLINTYLRTDEGSKWKGVIDVYKADTREDLIRAMREATSDDRAIVVIGGNSSPMDDTSLEVLFESLYAKKSVIVGGATKDFIRSGYLMGIYTNAQTAEKILKKWLLSPNIEKLSIDLYSKKVPPYMIILTNRFLMENLGVTR